MKTVNIIGCGKVGKVIGKLLALDFTINCVYNRTEAAALESVKYIQSGNPVWSLDNLTSADLWFFACSDDAISSISSAIANLINVENSVAWHCSGVKSGCCIDERFTSRVSIHPITSFISERFDVNILKNVFCGVEGDYLGQTILVDFFKKHGAKIVTIDGEQKALYHAAAVFTSNFLPQLIEAALQCYEKAGIDRKLANEMVKPLLESTVKNILAVGPKGAQTGPASRGDFLTLQKHEEGLRRELPHLSQIYWQLSELVAEKNGNKMDILL